MKVPVNVLYPTPLTAEAEWSFSRWRIFARCRREFAFHYLAARGGWDPGMPEVLQELYRFKKVFSLDLHVCSIIRNTFFELASTYRNGNGDDYRTDFLRYGKRRAAMLVRELAAREFYGVNDCGNAVLEIVNGELEFDEAVGILYDKTEVAALLLLDNFQDTFSTFSPLDWVGTQTVNSFSCEDVTIYLPRGAAWIKKGRAGWLDISMNGSERAASAGSDEWRRYWFFRKYSIDPGRTDVKFYDIFTGQTFARDILDLDFSGAKEIMINQAAIMRDWVRKAVDSAFDVMESMPEKETDCSKCRFRKFCEKNGCVTG